MRRDDGWNWAGGKQQSCAPSSYPNCWNELHKVTHVQFREREREKFSFYSFDNFQGNMEAVIESSRLWLESEFLLFFARSRVVHRLKDAHRMIIIIVWYYWYRSMAVICLCDAFRKFNGSRIIFDFVNGWNVRLSPTLLALIVFTSLFLSPLVPIKFPEHSHKIFQLSVYHEYVDQITPRMITLQTDRTTHQTLACVLSHNYMNIHSI